MQIPPTGLILLVLGAGMFAFAPRALYRTFIFFIPFSAFSVINYQGAASGHWLPATNYLGLLCLLRALLGVAFRGSTRLRQGRGRYLAALLVFVLVACVSLVMPALINGELRIISADIDSVSYPLVLNGTHLIHLSQLLFGVAIASLILLSSATLAALRETMRVYVASLIFVCTWGWLEFLCYQVSIPFPFQIFNNSIDDASLTGAGRVLTDIDLKRITSVSVEPSILAQALVVGVPVVLIAIWQHQPLLSRRWDRVALVAIVSTLILSASSSAYVSLAFTLLLTLGIHVAMRGADWRPLLWVGAIVAGSSVAYLLVPAARQFVDIYLTGKLSTESGLGRVITTINGFYYFQAYPVLGVGWGSISTYDVVVRLLANTGVIGLAAFLSACGMIGFGALRVALRRTAPALAALKPTAAGVAVAFGSLLFVMQVAGFSYEFLHIWLVFGLTMAVAALGVEQAPAELLARAVP